MKAPSKTVASPRLAGQQDREDREAEDADGHFVDQR